MSEGTPSIPRRWLIVCVCFVLSLPLLLGIYRATPSVLPLYLAMTLLSAVGATYVAAGAIAHSLSMKVVLWAGMFVLSAASLVVIIVLSAFVTCLGGSCGTW
jgi:hypothetical protein